MPALPASQGVFPASSPGMDSHRLPDDQPIFDQLPDLLAWEITIYLVSQVGPSPTSHNSKESKQDMTEAWLTSLVFKNGANWGPSISFLKTKTKKQQNFYPFRCLTALKYTYLGICDQNNIQI